MSTEHIRIDLTNDQKEQLRRESGHAIEAIQLGVEELESRIAPSGTVKYLQFNLEQALISN
jgi:hypothetical protein